MQRFQAIVPRWKSNVADIIQAIRGMNDVLPAHSPQWQHLENVFSNCLRQYGYQEIRMPIVESTQLFNRSIGEVTDIVEKEMYTFTDLNGDSLTLRPEGTAGCIRACIEHGLLYNQQQKLWYLGPMFRHEKPQKGRYRQFVQLGVEALGISGSAIEVELIALCRAVWQQLSILSNLTLEINSIGTLAERANFKTALVSYLTQHLDELDEDSQRRLNKNPLRILDSKNPTTQALLTHAPKLSDFLEEGSRVHFAEVCAGLDALQITYKVNPSLVRGLDYYGQTVFEWVTDRLGAQATLCAGGRYDILIEQLGGKANFAVGMAFGLERILLLLETLQIKPARKNVTKIYLISDKSAITKALSVAETLRQHDSSWQILTDTQLGSFKSQFKRADKAGAQLALILGEDEFNNNQISIKHLLVTAPQETILLDNLEKYLSKLISTNNLGER